VEKSYNFGELEMTIYIDGFERSGNTYLTACVTSTLATEISPLFAHDVSCLKEKEKGSLFVVPVRDALPSIVSAKLFRDYKKQNNIREHDKRTGDPEELIQRYTEYTDYLTDNDDFFIAPFKEFTEDHNKVIDVMIKNFSEYSAVQRFTKQQMINICNAYYSNIHSYTINKENSPYLNNFPRQEAKEKKDIEEMFKSEYSKEIGNIQSNIDELYKRYYREEAEHGNIG